MALYSWNARISGAFAELLQHVEVIVRNAMHQALTTHHATISGRPTGTAWFDGPRWVAHHWFGAEALDAISVARRRAHHSAKRPRPGKVVSELSFGFWRYLTSSRYEQSLWKPALDGAFTAPGTTLRDRRLAVEDRLAPLHLIRNRIAHCEPIFGDLVYRRRRLRPLSKSLASVRADALELVSWVSPLASRWLATDIDQVAALLAARPDMQPGG